MSKPRPPRRVRGYDEDWLRLRKRFIVAHPKCCECGKPAQAVDHIKTVRERPDLRLVWDNLRSMCFSCHNRRTAYDQVHAERRRLRAANADGTPSDPNHPWNKQP